MKKIFIVEDDSDILYGLSDIFSSNDYEVELSDSTEELDDLFNDDYIRRISNLFGILLKDEEKNNIRCQILKK